jgi:hypothetical protein
MLVLAGAAPALLAPAANAETPVGSTVKAPNGIAYVVESEATFLGQLASHQVSAVVINKAARSVHITLADGTHVLAHYPRRQEPRVAKQLKRAGVHFSVLSPAEGKAELRALAKKKGVHHKLRYIAGGILLLVIVVVGLVLYINRRRKRTDEVPAGAQAPSG